MLLQRLVEYADMNPEDVPPPFYKPQQVRWTLDLKRDGSPASAALTDWSDPTDRVLKNGPIRIIPSITKTSGIAPKIAVDTPEYLFGWVEDGAKPTRVAQAHEAFRALTDGWAAADPEGPASSLQAFYKDGHAERFPVQEGCGRGDLIAVRVEGRFLFESESAKKFWAGVASSRKTLGIRGLCLVCGEVGDLLKTVPQQLPTRLVPLATQTASLVSVNKATHGFALQEQLVHTPLCVSCGLAAMGALERLLDDQWQSSQPGQDTRLAWWTTDGSELDMDALDRPTPQSVARLVGSPARGEWSSVAPEDDLAAFCAVAIGGNVSRVVVRDWIEMPLTKIRANIGAWFADHEMVDVWTGEVTKVGLQRFAYVSGRWISGPGDTKGSYAKSGASGSDRPEGMYQALLRSALLGKPLPPKLLAHLVRRVCTDGRLDTERAALIRLAARRRPGGQDKELYLPLLNPNDNRPAYLSGRLFAVLEDIQLSASYVEGDPPPNLTFADRYFSRAVTSPAVALSVGRRDSPAWLKRLRRNRPAFAQVAEKRLDDLFSQLNSAGGVPHGAVLAEQTSFILGYHQQRADLRAGRSRNTSSGDNSQEEGDA